MKIISETNLLNFEAWSGAVYTKNTIIEHGKVDQFEQLIEDIYPDGLTDTQLNDILWFEADWIYESLEISIEE